MVDSLIDFYFPSLKMVRGVKSFKRGYLRATPFDCLYIIRVKNFLNTGQLKLII